MAHAHDLSCLEEKGGRLICSQEPSGSSPASIISYRNPTHLGRTAPLVPLRATIYLRGEMFGIVHKIEVTKLSIHVGKYAQFSSAVGLSFVPRNKRNVRSLILTDQPAYLLALEGWGHPDPDAGFVKKKSVPGLSVEEGRYLAHDPRFASDFDKLIDRHLGQSRVIADFRKHNPYDRIAG